MKIKFMLPVVLFGLLLAACGGQATPDPVEVAQRIATAEAEDALKEWGYLDASGRIGKEVSIWRENGKLACRGEHGDRIEILQHGSNLYTALGKAEPGYRIKIQGVDCEGRVAENVVSKIEVEPLKIVPTLTPSPTKVWSKPRYIIVDEGVDVNLWMSNSTQARCSVSPGTGVEEIGTGTRLYVGGQKETQLMVKSIRNPDCWGLVHEDWLK